MYSQLPALNTLLHGSGWRVVRNGVIGQDFSKCWQKCQTSNPGNAINFDDVIQRYKLRVVGHCRLNEIFQRSGR